MYHYQTIHHQEIPKYRTKLAEFFLKLGYRKKYHTAIDNTAFICVCWENKKLVGAGRVVSDLNRFAFIVDLNVKKIHRRKGIGRQLIENLVKECQKKKIDHIELSTDPRYPWLEEFYKKAGFKMMTDSVKMEYK